jgi:hypothetical protein
MGPKKRSSKPIVNKTISPITDIKKTSRIYLQQSRKERMTKWKQIVSEEEINTRKEIQLDNRWKRLDVEITQDTEVLTVEYILNEMKMFCNRDIPSILSEDTNFKASWDKSIKLFKSIINSINAEVRISNRLLKFKKIIHDLNYIVKLCDIIKEQEELDLKKQEVIDRKIKVLDKLYKEIKEIKFD